MSGMSRNKFPAHTHDCDKCKFIMSINIHTTKGIEKTVDLYHNCSDCDSDITKYIVRYSSEGSDYATCNLETFLEYYVVGHFGDLRERFYNFT